MEYVTEGEVVRTFKAMVEKMFQGAATAKAKGALLITPEQVIVTTLGQTIKRFWHKTKLQVKRCHGKRLFVIGKHLIAESRFTVHIAMKFHGYFHDTQKLSAGYCIGRGWSL